MPSPQVAAATEAHMRKEFIMQMQAKGKLPRVVTEASERHDKTYYETTDRIFPGPGGMEGVLLDMIRASGKRIDHATASSNGSKDWQAAGTQGAQAHTAAPPSASARSMRHQATKDKLAVLEGQLHVERQARIRAEEQLSEARSGMSSAGY